MVLSTPALTDRRDNGKSKTGNHVDLQITCLLMHELFDAVYIYIYFFFLCIYAHIYAYACCVLIIVHGIVKRYRTLLADKSAMTAIKNIITVPIALNRFDSVFNSYVYIGYAKLTETRLNECDLLCCVKTSIVIRFDAR